MFETMFGLILVLAGLYLWQNALRAREQARGLAHELCAGAGVQLLDQTVSLTAVGFRRAGDGRLHLRRSYAFEVSLDGHDRQRGSLQMLDGRVLAWSVPGAPAPSFTSSAASRSNVIELPRPDKPGPRLH